MSRDIECPICFEDDLDKFPAKLPCGHMVCTYCLIAQTVHAIDAQKDGLTCPLCRSTIKYIREPFPEHLSTSAVVGKMIVLSAIGALGIYIVMVLIQDLLIITLDG